MATTLKSNSLKSIKDRRYLNKEFQALQNDLIDFAKRYYQNKNLDFSDNSLGGLLIDLPAYIGDNLSYYLDHQFSELDPEQAVEVSNIEKHILQSGIEITGASPAVVVANFYVKVPATTSGNKYIPLQSSIPVIQADTTATAVNGTSFKLIEDVDFTLLDDSGNLKAEYRTGDVDASGNPVNFIFQKSGLLISGDTEEERFSIGSFIPFRRITLANPDIYRIESVFDDLGNVYYEADNLTQDTVYKLFDNYGYDSDIVPKTIRIIPNPYRFTKNVSLTGRYTTLTFGGGSASTLEDDAFPDPSEFALPLYGRTTFSMKQLDPQRLMSTKTLGIISENTNLTVRYRYGGGLSHNVEQGAIRNIDVLNINFPGSPSSSIASFVRNSVAISNPEKAQGGEDAPSISDLQYLVSNSRAGQSRIVGKEDIAARVYSLPKDLGSVFRMSSRPNPTNPLAASLYVVSRDESSRLVQTSDTLKENIKTYLSKYRMTSDGIDILDSSIVDFSIDFEIVVEKELNKRTVIKDVTRRLQNFLRVENFQIDQVIIVNDIEKVIKSADGVTSISGLSFRNITGYKDNRQYSEVSYDLKSNTRKGMIIPPAGGIFHLRYSELDITGRAI